MSDRKRSRLILIGTAVFVTAINISVFNIWIPARLQISERYVGFIMSKLLWNPLSWDRIPKAWCEKEKSPPVTSPISLQRLFKALPTCWLSWRYHFINEIWDRIEKVLYLLVDGVLNWWFLKTVKSSLINNGLNKYNKLVRFNQRIVVLSLCMDVMIIAAMSIPNSFV
jgi:hypothetical protein